MEWTTIAYVLGIPLMCYCAYRWGFQEGIEHAVEVLIEQGLLKEDPEG